MLLWTLAGLGVVSAGLYAATLGLGDWRAQTTAFLILFLALYCISLAAYFLARRVKSDDRRFVAVIVAAAALFRLLIWVAPPTLSDDIYRYVFDGRLQLAGISPFAYAPNDPHLAKIRERAGYDKLGDNRHTLAVYQPVAQVLFAGAAATGDYASYTIKGMLALLDMGTILFILGILRRLKRPPGLVILYAWSPLAVFEIAGSGHIDGLAAFLAVAGVYAVLRRRSIAGGALAGLAAATKLLPASVLPALNRRPRDWRSVAGATIAVTAVYAPYLAWGGSPLPFNNAGGGLAFNQGLKAAMIWLSGGAGPGVDNAFAILAGAVLLSAGIYFWSRPKSDAGIIRAAFWLTGLVIVLLPYTVPWYLILWLPFIAIEESFAGIYLSGAVMLSYLFYAQQPWGLPAWIQPAEFVPFFALLAWDLRRLPPRSTTD